MPKATVKIYDANDNLVEELPYGKNGITGVETNNQRQQVYQDIDKDGNKIFVASEGFSDPFARAGSEITQMVSIQAPKVKIDGNKLVVQASKDVMPTPIVAQIKEELQSLKGSDLSSPEVKRAIDALNEEISTNLEDTMLKSSLGWTKDQYNDYQYIRQTVSRSNPMSSSNKIKGKDKEGKIIMKTPQEWIDYYRSAYNVDERTDAYKKSFTATDPYDRTMALVMGQGKTIPVYGFDAADRLSQGWKALENQMGKFPEGTLRFFAEDNDTKRVEGIVKNKNIPVESMRKFNINNEDQFAAKKEALKGKSWNELSDDDKAFLVLLGVSREGELERDADTSEAMKDYRGKKTNTFAWETNKQDYERAERKAAREIGTSDLNGAISDDEETSRAAIDRILSNNSFDRYRTARNNYDTWQGYEDWSNVGEKELQNTAFWSGNEQAVGNIAGTIGRFLWEDAVLRGLTGGIGGGGVSMNAVSDAIGSKIVGKLASHGIAPTSKIGRGLLQFSANLVGTIPEDILQTSVDNVLTYNIDENTHLLNPEEMSNNLRNNLIFMSLFNAARAGISSIKKARMLKKLEKAADLNQKINIGGIKADADDIARAVENGGAIKVDGDKVSVVDVDGKETVLKNTTPEQAEMVQRSLFDYAMPDLDKGELKAGDKIEFETTYGGRQRWFDGEIVEENGKLKIRGDGYEDIDVDANEVYRVRRRIGDNGAFDQEGTNKATTEPKTEPETVKVEAEDSEAVKDWKEQISDAEERLKQYIPQDNAKETIPKMSYEERKRIAKEVASDSDGEYIVLYRVQGGEPDQWRPNSRGKEGKFEGEAGELKGAVWLTADAEWAEGPERASAGVSSEWTGGKGAEVTNDNIVVIPVKKSDILELNRENGAKEALDESGKKIVKTRGIDNGLKKSEYILWENEHPEIFDDGMELMLNKRNELLEKSSVDKRIARKIQNEIDGLRSSLEAQLADERAASGVENSPELVEEPKAEAEKPKTEIETTRVETEEPKVKVEVDTPDGPVRVDTVDYRFRNIDDATDPNVRVEPSPAGVKHWHRRALEAIMRSFRDNLAEFRNRFGDVRASDFDWVYYNTRKGLTPEQIIGTTDPTTGRTINQNMIDAMKWWSEQSFTKKLRTGSREALGLEGDFDTLGYLPHTSYDPSSLSYDEAVAGQLWKKFTGKSVIKDGRYVGYGGTLDGRYRTFASNMLWDMRNKEVAASKLIEEAQLEGKTLSPEQAMKAVEGGQNIQKSVNESPSTKKLTKNLSSSKGDVDWKEINKNVKEEGQKSGLSKAIHDNYQDVYSGANSAQVVSQPGTISEGLSQQSDIMKKIRIGNGMSMYDYGGADIVYASQNAIELVNRFMRDGGDFKQLLVNYIEQHSHRSPKYAEAVADRWIAKMNSAPGEMTKGKAIVELSSSMRSEAMSRLRKFLVMADYNGKVGVDGKRVGGFNDSTKKFIDDFLFRHMQMENIKNNPSISKMVTGALNGLTGLRYRALFYGNFKNALLQVSELNRLFTVFKWGDVGQMLKKLATDGDFRARVDTYVEAVSPETTFLDSEVYGKYGKLADSAEVGEDGITFKKIKDGVDDIALAPINKAESIKNRTMIAALVQEADRMGLSGDEALRHIRSRFERVALANNEMGRIGLSSNRLAKPMLFLQNFQIRELGMHYYNIKDATGVGKSLPKKVLDATKYLTKVFGAKLATTLILARLGYSASQTLGFDPFGLADRYNKLDEDEMNVIDKQISGGVLTPFFAGGMTSLVSDMYFMARKAYEDSVRETVSDEAEASLNDEIGGGADWSAVFSPDYMLGLGAGFVPGNVFLNRIGQMNEMMDTGWATSSTGNKMYAAPNDPLNTILGYLFGRSATQNALQYNQSYGDDIGQTISRTLGKTLSNMFGGGYQQFDPIDTKNYSDWFKGDEGDQQQFNKGLRYFRQQRDNILGAYNDAINKSWSSDDEIAEAKNDMNVKLDELYNSLERFVSAYENKNGTIDSAMAKQIITVLNTGQEVLEDDSTQRNERGLGNNSKALERYANLGLSPVGTYSGAYGEGEHAEDEVKYQGSPQWRIAKGAKYDLRSEAAAVLRAGDATLEDLRKGYKDKISAAYDNKDYDELKRIQKEYLMAFDKVVGPIMATYGNGILSNGDVVEELTEMLSTDSGKNADFIPRDDWTLGTNNRWLSTKKYPIAGVDVKKWLKERYSNDIYKTPTVRSYSTAQDDIDEIKRLSAQGKPDRARARALQLKVRVDNQVRSLSNSDYKWLLDFLNNGGK